MSSSDDSDKGDPVYLFNKKEVYEKQIAEGKPDLRREEVNRLLKVFQDSFEAIYGRRKNIDGVGILSAQHVTFTRMLDEAFETYELGYYYSTISICGTVAERICYDFVAIADVKFFGKSLIPEATALLYDLPFRSLLELMMKIGALDEASKNRLHEIYNIRNRYVHPKQPGDAGADALTVLNKLCKVMEDRFSMFRFYDLVDGVFRLKPGVGKS